MAFDPTNPVQLDKLARAIDWSRYRLQPFREHRLAMLRQIVGAHYSNSGAPQRVPVNLLGLAANIYLRQLVAKAPRAMVSSKDAQLKPVAGDMQAWLDHAAEGMRLAESLRICVMNALLSIGIMKIGEAHLYDAEILGTMQHIGQPFAEPVDLDDWVHDITAKRYDQAQFAGNRYRMQFEEARDHPMFDPVARGELVPMTRHGYNERGDSRTTTLSQSNLQASDEVGEHVELWDIWLPREKLVLTIPYQDSVQGGFTGQKPLRIVQWQGPAAGPFVILSYADVPNNVMPAAPLQNLVDLHESANIAWRKVLRQMERQKTVLGVMGTAADDAERIQRANDGDAVRVDFPDRAKEMSTGGIRNENILAATQLKDIFSWAAGNLDILGGLSPQSNTLGQDELLARNSSAQVAEMQNRTIGFTREVQKALAHHWWKNPVLTYDTVRQAAPGIDVPVSITPQMRQVPFEKLDIDIDPYSMQDDTPQTRLNLMMQMVQQLAPFLPMAQQQGVSLDLPALVQFIGRYGNFPDLGDILKVGPPPSMQQPMQMAQEAVQGAGEPPGKPAVTHRVNTRISRPGTTRQGQSDVMAQLLSGGGQPKQANMVGRTAA